MRCKDSVFYLNSKDFTHLFFCPPVPETARYPLLPVFPPYYLIN